MRFSRNIIALAATILAVEAQTTGFNSGSTKTDGSVKTQTDFENEFRAMQNLPGATCFNSVRLFTSIQGGSANSPISAIPAAIATKTTILLGLWASGGQDVISNEILAIQAAISQYGSSFTDLVVGVSVGSEDLYRDSAIAAQQNNVLPGIGPTTLVDYIGQVRKALSGTALSSKGIGHVDTWTSWVNGTDSPVIGAVDWIGVDAYPYFENTLPDNSVSNGKNTFDSAISQVNAVASGKPVWITETGWPTSGPTEAKAVPSVDNAKTYWQDVGCSLFGTTNTWWYILDDAGSSPSFGIVPSIGAAPYFDLTCPSGSSGAKVCGSGSSSSSSSSSSASSSTSVASASAPSSTAGTATATVVASPGSAYGTGTAVPVNPSSSGATAAPYPTTSGAAGSSAAGVGGASGYAPMGTGAIGATTMTKGSATASTTAASFTGAADKIGAAAGAGFLALLGVAAAL